MKKDTFLKGAFILGLAGILVKIVGAFFRIPLGNIIGSEGFGYYQVAYPIYTFLLSFSAAGFPTAISKLVSEHRARGDIRGGHRVFQVSFRILAAMGIVSFLFLGLGAKFLVNNFIKSPSAYYSVLALAPALLVVPLMAAYRGYFQGLKNMVPTAVSQVTEQIGRVALGLGLAVVLMPKGTEFAAAGASFGAAAGGIAGLLTMLVIYFRKKKSIVSDFQPIEQYEEESVGQITRDLLRIALPIIIGTAVLPLINMIDSMVVLRRLQGIGFSYKEANVLFGQLTGMAVTLIQLPPVITAAVSMSIVPVIAESMVKKDLVAVQKDSKSAVRVSMLLALPSFVGLAVLSTPIMTLLFPRESTSAGQVLLFLSFATFSLCMVQTLTGILQGLGKPEIPVRNLLIGALLKLVVTYTLAGIPWLNVRGAALGTVTAYTVATALNFISLKKQIKVKFELMQFVVKPIISAATMGIVVFLSYKLIYPILGNSLATIASVVVGGTIYGIMLLVTGTMVEEDFELLPKGDKIAQILRKAKLLK